MNKLRKVISNSEIQEVQKHVPVCRSKEFYLGFKAALYVIVFLLFTVTNKAIISRKIAAILIILENRLVDGS